MDMVRDMKKTASRRSFYAFFCLRAGGWVLRRPGGEHVLRLRARDGAFRAPARVPFFFCKKKGTKENHLDLRSKDPLARGGQVQIWRCVLAHEVRWVTLSVQGSLVPLAPLPLTAVRVGVGALVVFGDYQIAPFPPQGGKGRCARRAQDIIIS